MGVGPSDGNGSNTAPTINEMNRPQLQQYAQQQQAMVPTQPNQVFNHQKQAISAVNDMPNLGGIFGTADSPRATNSSTNNNNKNNNATPQTANTTAARTGISFAVGVGGNNNNYAQQQSIAPTTLDFGGMMQTSMFVPSEKTSNPALTENLIENELQRIGLQVELLQVELEQARKQLRETECKMDSQSITNTNITNNNNNLTLPMIVNRSTFMESWWWNNRLSNNPNSPPRP